MKILVKTLFGLEDVLAEEIKQMGGLKIEKLNRAVSFSGDLHLLYEANLKLRTALSVLVPVGNFNARDEDSLYKETLKIDWSEHIDLEQTFAIFATTNSTIFKHSKFAAYRVKDAIVDQFRDKTGRRPSIDSKNPDIKINVHIDNHRVSISLDSSGETLSRRGYRTDSNEAPINEVLAAGMLALANWNGERDFIDPMCGSGTIAIEAVMKAYNMAPGKFREKYAFMNWKNFDEKLWNEIVAKAEKNEKEEVDCKIYASDKSRRTIQLITTKNVQRCGLQDKIQLDVCAISKLEAKGTDGILMMNPPYGERLKEQELNILYRKIGDTLKHQFENHDAWVISSNADAFKHFGLKANQRIKLFNGQLECRFNHYELYAGSKKVQNVE